MILESYIQREIRNKLLWLIGLLILILTSHRFVDYLADAASGKIPGYLIMHMLTCSWMFNSSVYSAFSFH